MSRRARQADIPVQRRVCLFERPYDRMKVNHSP
jgi:hypothetical protein